MIFSVQLIARYMLRWLLQKWVIMSVWI